MSNSRLILGAAVFGILLGATAARTVSHADAASDATNPAEVKERNACTSKTSCKGGCRTAAQTWL